ncbi:MAG TPA: hypothetical protein VI911_00875 [Patescibacteria group bacterium]|nr:hypothetical protein [Patescibacteria group bacterium]
MTTINRMDIKEFREFGFLQEANRLFFHPLGLALEIMIDDETGEECLGGIWDYRDDPEGMAFGDGTIQQNKIDNVEKLRLSKVASRKQLFGNDIQGV